jgi:hypothetical protein
MQVEMETGAMASISVSPDGPTDPKGWIAIITTRLDIHLSLVD